MLQNVEEEATVMGSGKYNSLFDTQDKCNVYTLEIILCLSFLAINVMDVTILHFSHQRVYWWEAGHFHCVKRNAGLWKFICFTGGKNYYSRPKNVTN